MNIRTKLSESASEQLIAIMHHMNHEKTNHTLNVIIGNLYKQLFNEVNTHDRNATTESQ